MKVFAKNKQTFHIMSDIRNSLYNAYLKKETNETNNSNLGITSVKRGSNGRR